MHKFNIKIVRAYASKIKFSILNTTNWISTCPGVIDAQPLFDMDGSGIYVEIEENKLESFLLEFEKKVSKDVPIQEMYNAFRYESESNCAAILNTFVEKRKSEIEEENAMNQIPGPEHRIVGYSKEMAAYIQEVKRISEAFDSINQKNKFYEKALLVSMDKNWGYEEFLACICKTLEAEKELVNNTPVYYEKYVREHKSDTLERQRRVVHSLATDLFGEDAFAIYSYDISDALGDINNATFLEHVRLMKEDAERVFCVFNVPYMNAESLAEIEDVLSEVVSIQSIQVPPVPMENQIDYMKVKFMEAGFKLEEGMDEGLAEWIQQEVEDGYFYGYQTLNKMVSELIYQKVSKGTNITEIQLADIKYWIDKTSEVEQDAYELLNELIGMNAVKERVREIVAQVKLQKKLEAEGKEIEKPSLHMMFIGNPGTGKTTVARVIGKIFRQENLLSVGNFSETTGSAFVTRYVGSGSELVRNACKQAHGSVLFIDEAYGMSVGTQKGNITDETLPILVAEMENHREDMCIIFAGYQDEMEAFLSQNSGLKSRIPHIIEFPNYSREELVEIFDHIVNGKFEYEDQLKETLIEYLANIDDSKFEHKTFSNGRFVRNLYERLWGKAAYRMSFGEDKSMILKNEDMVNTLEEEDFKAMLEENEDVVPKRIGFISE